MGLRQWTCDLRLVGSSPGQIIMFCPLTRHFISLNSLKPTVQIWEPVGCNLLIKLCPFGDCGYKALGTTPRGHVDVSSATGMTFQIVNNGGVLVKQVTSDCLYKGVNCCISEGLGLDAKL